MNVFSSAYWGAVRPVRTLQSIQVLRACAALSVVLYHTHIILRNTGQASYFDLFAQGYLGVDLFFVISGFIITYTSRSYVGHPGSLRRYLSKRFWRIYPVYWLCLLCIVLYAFVRTGAATGSGLGPMFSFKNLLDNLLLIPAQSSFLHDSWSLSHEVYFYLLFGLLLVSRTLLVVPLLVMSGTLLSGFWWLTNQPGYANEFIGSLVFSPFNLEFGFGVLLSFLVGRRVPGLIPGSVLVFLLAAGILYQMDITSVWNRVVWAGLFSFSMVYLVTAWEDRMAFLVPSLLIKLGDASYVLYLVHGSLLLALNRVIIRFDLISHATLLFALAIPLLSWACLVIHQRVELPLVQLGRRRITWKLPYRAAGSGTDAHSDLKEAPEFAGTEQAYQRTLA